MVEAAGGEMESVEVVGRVGDKIVVCVRNEASLKHLCTSLGRGKQRGEKRGTGDKLVLDASCKQRAAVGQLSSQEGNARPGRESRLDARRCSTWLCVPDRLVEDP